MIRVTHRTMDASIISHGTSDGAVQTFKTVNKNYTVRDYLNREAIIRIRYDEAVLEIGYYLFVFANRAQTVDNNKM